MKNLIDINLIFLVSDQASKGFKHTFISKDLVSRNTLDTASMYGSGKCIPLYLYYLSLDGTTTRKPNVDPKLINEICKKLNAERIEDQEIDNLNKLINHTTKIIGPVDLFDYIYAVLHSPAYRDTYAEFLKIDFPRVPFTDDLEKFWTLVGYGRQLRGIHLMETITIDDLITTYPMDGTNEVVQIGKKSYVVPSSPSEGDTCEGVKKKWKIELTQESVRKRGLIRDGKSFPYNPNNTSRAKEMRKTMTKAEQKVWFEILQKHDYKFYRQRPIDHYIVDFYCSKLDLVIEIDGESHSSDDAKSYDTMRTELLNHYGLTVLRFTNQEVFKNIGGVHEKIEEYISEYIQKSSPLGGEMPKAEGGKVYINDTQYFDGVPKIAREFYIGGYQPAQKRLKDRKGRTLSYDDIIHYQMIIVALTKTSEIMEKIDEVEIL